MDSEKKNSFLEDLTTEEKPESFQEEVFYKTKKNYIPTIIFTSIGLVIFIVLFIVFTKGSVVPDMTGWNEGEIYTWAKSNNATIVKEEAYSLEVDKGIIIEQDIAAGDKVKRHGTLKVVISMGPDPEEKIEFPNVKEMTLGQIETWIDNNKLSAVSVKKEYNNVFEKDQVISVEFKDGEESNFVRKNRVQIFISLGEEGLKDTITVPDFSSKTKADVMKWSTSNEIEVTFTESFNEYIETGKVFTQNIAGNTKMKRTDTLDITISLGKALVVPNFVGVKREDAIEMAKLENVQLHFKNEISSKPEGTIISQDIEAGSTVSSEQIITANVATASDNVTVPSLVGLTKGEASTLASIYDIKTFFVGKSSTEKQDQVIEQSVSPGSVINKETLVTIYVSSGDILVPNLVGLEKDEVQIIAEKLGLQLIFKEEATAEFENDTIIEQSQAVDTVLESSEKMIVSVASNNGTKVPRLTGMSRSEVELWGTLNDTAITVVEKYSDTIPAGSLFDQNYVNAYVPGKEPLIVYQSLGKVAVSDFTGQNKLVVQDWLKEVNDKGANIELNVVGATDTTKPVGTVVSQSTRVDFVDIGSTLTIHIAEANASNSVPDFSNLTKVVISSWCSENNVEFKIVERYSDVYMRGTIFGQNYVGQTIPSGETLVLYESLGNVSRASFVNSNRSFLDRWVNEKNVKGAGLSVNYTYKYVEGKREDTVLSQVFEDNNRSMNTTINVTLASAKSVPIPSFIGITMTQACEELDALGIPYECKYIKLNGEKVLQFPKYTVFNQSVTGTYSFEKGGTIQLSVSNGTSEE